MNLKIVVLDVDGTMTDGGIYIDNKRVETKKFSIKDGAGILLAQQMGIEFMILTGRRSHSVEQRANELKVKYVVQEVRNKQAYLEQFMERNIISKDELAYIGDDLNDLPAMKIVGYCACPVDAASEVKNYCDIVLSKKGGEGAVREFIEIVLKNRNQWENAIEKLFALKL
ncbi:MAG TPA: 3-deoxy-D-manno-octulosonate 8-phosphate phosphatase [Firmicutes bacterium]|jgi:3-deoxy-D-manno-octulosonate 8-phosphate phosphatase (KDO 8-P phosphatase)|nr:3-deoxy-D-manno-octulosonate 8-phosphate phosphatase [Bacillota bacterium]